MIWSLIIVALCFLFAFFCVRFLLDDIINYLINKSARKKREKKMTFKEWFTFSRFRTEIPYYHIVIYYIIITVYIALFILTFIMYISNSISNSNLYRTILIAFTAILLGIYKIALEGLHTTYTHLYKKDKIHFRGIDKKAYREKMRKLNEQVKKETIKNEENSNNNAK